jgi:hypothetical protein
MIFEKGEIPGDFKKIVLIFFCKKGNKSECGNYSGISFGFCKKQFA